MKLIPKYQFGRMLPEIVVGPQKREVSQEEWQRQWGNRGAAAVNRAQNRVAKPILDGLLTASYFTPLGNVTMGASALADAINGDTNSALQTASLMFLPYGGIGKGGKEVLKIAEKINSTPRGRAIGRVYNKGARTANNLMRSGQPTRVKSIRQFNNSQIDQMTEQDNPLVKELFSRDMKLVHLSNGKNKYMVRDSKGKRYLIDVPKPPSTSWEAAQKEKWAEINRNGIVNPTAQGNGDGRWLKYGDQETSFNDIVRPLSDWITYK